MKIATFNCNSVRARIDVISRWIQENNPDILALQEIKVETDKFPYSDFESLGYHCVVSGKKAHAGVAILSLNKPDYSEPGFRDGDEMEFSRILTCKWGKLFVVNTYIPQGRDIEHEQYQYKLQWFKRMREYLDSHFKKSQKLIWLGDFNVAPEPFDVYDSKRLMGHVDHNPVVSDALDHVRKWGFIDLFRKFHPEEENQFSYFDYRVVNAIERNMGWRVDHIYVTKSLSESAQNCYIDLNPRSWDKPSDHTFMVAEFTEK